MSGNKSINIKIMGKDYKVSCPTGQESQLFNAATLLNEKMTQLKSSGRIIGLEKIAVMAGLNLANELLSQQTNLKQDTSALYQQLETLCEKMDESIFQPSS